MRCEGVRSTKIRRTHVSFLKKEPRTESQHSLKIRISIMVVTSTKRVAVIGAGISGTCAAANLLKHGLDVVLFERSGIAGGVWHFDKRSAPDPEPYPNEIPSKGDYQQRPDLAYSTPPPEEEDVDKQEIDHAPPGPCYYGLKNNISTREMRTSLLSWPEGTEDIVSQKVLEEYIQGIAAENGVNAIAQYHTRVENVRKQQNEWIVRTTSLQKNESGGRRLCERHWVFDFVVVASGHVSPAPIESVGVSAGCCRSQTILTRKALSQFRAQE